MESNGNCPIVDYLEELMIDPESFGTVVDAMQRLSDPRWWGPPNTTKLQGRPYKGIFELRVKRGNRYMRLPFIQTKNAEIILMFGETKKRATPTTAFMERARRYRDMIYKKEVSYEQINFNQFKE